MYIFGDFDKSDLPKDASDEAILYRLRYAFLNNILRTALWLTFYLCLTHLLGKMLETPPNQLYATAEAFERLLDKVLSIGLQKPLLWALFFLITGIAAVLGFLAKRFYNDRERIRRELELLKMRKRKNETSASDSDNACPITPPVGMDK